MCTCSLFTMGSSQQQPSLICISRGIIIYCQMQSSNKWGNQCPIVDVASWIYIPHKVCGSMLTCRMGDLHTYIVRRALCTPNMLVRY